MHVTVECLLFARILIYEALPKYNSCIQKYNTTRDTRKKKNTAKVLHTQIMTLHAR